MATVFGTISSIATLILFAFYFIGKYFTIKKQEVFLSENIHVSYQVLDDVTIRDSIDLGEMNSERVYLSSSQPLRYIRFYSYDFEKSFDKQKTPLEKEYTNLKNGQILQVNTYLTCGIPNYYVEYQRFDYVLGKLILAENGKNGDLMEHLQVKHTWRSILYYLVN